MLLCTTFVGIRETDQKWLKITKKLQPQMEQGQNFTERFVVSLHKIHRRSTLFTFGELRK